MDVEVTLTPEEIEGLDDDAVKKLYAQRVEELKAANKGEDFSVRHTAPLPIPHGQSAPITTSTPRLPLFDTCSACIMCAGHGGGQGGAAEAQGGCQGAGEGRKEAEGIQVLITSCRMFRAAQSRPTAYIFLYRIDTLWCVIGLIRSACLRGKQASLQRIHSMQGWALLHQEHAAAVIAPHGGASSSCLRLNVRRQQHHRSLMGPGFCYIATSATSAAAATPGSQCRHCAVFP